MRKTILASLLAPLTLLPLPTLTQAATIQCEDGAYVTFDDGQGTHNAGIWMQLATDAMSNIGRDRFILHLPYGSTITRRQEPMDGATMLTIVPDMPPGTVYAQVSSVPATGQSYTYIAVLNVDNKEIQASKRVQASAHITLFVGDDYAS